jgi:hypothetical protein
MILSPPAFDTAGRQFGMADAVHAALGDRMPYSEEPVIRVLIASVSLLLQFSATRR